VDRITSQQRSANMQRIKSKGMKPEVRVRRFVHRLGYRFRLHSTDLPGTPDLVFPGRKKVIFVHGCFWHQHPDPDCRAAHMPQSNTDYWLPKLARTKTRDFQTEQQLASLGWSVLVVWECRLHDDAALAYQLRRFLDTGCAAGTQGQQRAEQEDGAIMTCETSRCPDGYQDAGD
jgi:DNA mismatch endonuclease (patch repair protein)